ncbi:MULTISPECIES: hypothetical protein [Bacillus]|nr:MULTISPECIES: hypothetical protein [Bacillus]
MKKIMFILAAVSLTSFIYLGAVHTPSEQATTFKVAENGAFG